MTGLPTDRHLGGPITDPVTGALPRGALEACLEGAILGAARAEGACSVFLFDVDHFKTVNDAYGHARGDIVLHQVTARVTDLLRSSDILIRYGGDEFVVVLPGAGRVEATEAAARLVEGVKGTPFPGNPPLSVSISLGVATYPDDAAAPDDLVEVADRRNYLAKRRGRGRAVADDLASAAVLSSGRLLERDAALAAAQEFLAGLAAGGRGALRVAGDRGAGHTRLLAEVGTLARLRGFDVRGPEQRHLPSAAGPILMIADTDADWAVVTELVHDLTSGRPDGPAGLLYAVHDPAGKPSLLPLTATVALTPLSAAALRVWLRTALSGEPGPALVDWMADRCGGLVARVERELARLSAEGSLERQADGGWDLAPAVLARARQARRRLPTMLSTLIGRERDTGRLVDLLAERRLVSVVGPGGIGKTRLALAVADAMADDFADGAAFVPLAEATTTDLVVATVADVLEIAEVPDERLADTVVHQLTGRELLLVLDNFEQVIEAAPFVAATLAAAPGVRVLATSRQRLRLSGEQVYPIPALELPDPDARPEEAVAAPALALFVARAKEAAYHLELTPDDIRAIATLCRHLDGLPLAIELAAARCDLLTPVELLDQLTERFELLSDGPQDLPARQRTLRAAIDWSFALLDAADQELMTRLAVFAGGCTAEAAAAVCGPGGDLAGLVDKNLLSLAPGPRYTMLETIRMYAEELLAAYDRATEIRRRHAEYFAESVKRPHRWTVGPDEPGWQDRAAREYANLRTAFEWAMASGAETVAARISTGLAAFWQTGRHIGDGRDWLGRLLAVPTLPGELRGHVLDSAGFLALLQGDLATGRRLGEECLELARELDDPELTTFAYNVLGLVAKDAGDYEQSRAYHSQGLAIQQERGDPVGLAVARGNLTVLAMRMGDLETAHGYALLNLDLERQVGNLRGVALTLSILGDIHVRRGDTAGARPLLEESLRVSRQIGDAFVEGWALHDLGLASYVDGDLETAYRDISEALRLFHGLGAKEEPADAFDDLAELVVGTDPMRAARLLAAAEALREQYGASLAANRVERRDGTLARARAALDADRLAHAWASGRATPLDDMVREVLSR